MKVTIKAMSTEVIKRVNNEIDSSNWFECLIPSEGEGNFDVTLSPYTILKAYCGLDEGDELLIDYCGRKEFIKESEFYRVVIE